jgi:hypothetical protein
LNLLTSRAPLGTCPRTAPQPPRPPYTGWDSNPQHLVFETSASTNWTTRARAGHMTAWQLHHPSLGRRTSSHHCSQSRPHVAGAREHGVGHRGPQTRNRTSTSPACGWCTQLPAASCSSERPDDLEPVCRRAALAGHCATWGMGTTYTILAQKSSLEAGVFLDPAVTLLHPSPPGVLRLRPLGGRLPVVVPRA